MGRLTSKHAVSLPDLARLRVANGTVGASTLRGQGAAGIVAATRRYLGEKRVFDALAGVSTAKAFEDYLDLHTSALLHYWREPAPEILRAEALARKLAAKEGKKYRSALKRNIGSWAAARKCVNIFVLSARMNSLMKWPKGSIDDSWLELPIDSKVAERLAGDFDILSQSKQCELSHAHATVVGYSGLNNLNQKDHRDYQVLALEVAKVRRTKRAFLDLLYYSPGNLIDVGEI